MWVVYENIGEDKLGYLLPHASACIHDGFSFEIGAVYAPTRFSSTNSLSLASGVPSACLCIFENQRVCHIDNTPDFVSFGWRECCP